MHRMLEADFFQLTFLPTGVTARRRISGGAGIYRELEYLRARFYGVWQNCAEEGKNPRLRTAGVYDDMSNGTECGKVRSIGKFF